MNALQTCLLSVLLCGQTLPAEPAPGSREAVLEQFQKDAAGYEITLQTEPPSILKLHEKPVLNWVNPAGNGEDGVVYVWLKDGRPEVAGSVWTYLDPRAKRTLRKHAFHSLVEVPVTARFNGQLIWAPKEAGVKFHSVPAADRPAESARNRLTQMRSLSRQFGVTIERLNGDVSELRLLAQPLLRYEPKQGPAKDGAIFAFATGTDPDALLLIEARQTSEGLEWQYAFARFHFVGLTATHQGQKVWTADKDPDMFKAVFGDPAQYEKVYYSVVKPD